MSTSLVFNDSSIPFQTLDDCHRNLPPLFEILKLATKSQIQMLRVNKEMGSDWYSINFFPEFSLSQWIEDQHEIDYRRNIRRIMDKTACPIILSGEEEILNSFETSDFILEEGEASVPSVGAAYLLDAPVVSCMSMQCWKINSISIIHEFIDTISGELLYNKRNVINISRNAHIRGFLENAKSQNQNSNNYLRELKQSGNKDFKNLVFCSEALGNLKSSKIDDDMLSNIIDALNRLNHGVNTQTDQAKLIEETKLNISGESQSTKNDPKLYKHRRIKLPNGEFEYFDFHIKNFPAAHRLYFLPDIPNKKIYIGYFGKHLPTTKRPT